MVVGPKKEAYQERQDTKKGADTIRTVALVAQDMGIQKLILYAFFNRKLEKTRR